MLEHEEGQKSGPSVREFILDSKEGITCLQRGRVTKLAHPVYGATFLIDVTDRQDPTRYNPDSENPDEETSIDRIFGDRETAPEHYDANNGVVLLVTRRLDAENRSRVYIGITMFDPNNIEEEEEGEITKCILESARFRSIPDYVPFSFNKALIRKYVIDEINEAISL